MKVKEFLAMLEPIPEPLTPDKEAIVTALDKLVTFLWEECRTDSAARKGEQLVEAIVKQVEAL